MFRAKYIHDRMRQQPFVPARFVTSSGQAYDVYHPDLVLVGRRDVHIGIPRSEGDELYEDVVRLAIMHISAIEDLPRRSKRSGTSRS